MVQSKLRLADVAGADLVTLCKQIINYYKHDPSIIDGTVFAHLAEQLLAAEVQPGGPYNDANGNPALVLNATIGYLFILIGKPLPNIDAYLTRVSHKKLSARERDALKKYSAAKTRIIQTRRPPKRHAAYQRAEKTLKVLTEPIRTQTLQFLTRVEAADVTGEIAGLALFTNDALSAKLSTTKLNKLSEANIHSWIAYTIYDHILDKESDATLLPAANVCMRLAINLHKQSLPARHPLQALITDYFNQVDTVSSWELTFCRLNMRDRSITIAQLPDYKQYENLAWRSCIHILGALIVASTALSTTKMEEFTKGLHHYLIARQLADDIHDWREDLTAGRITAVVALLLKQQNIAPSTPHQLDELIAKTQEYFLQAGAQAICELILDNARQARSHLTSSGCKIDSAILTLVLRLENMAKSSLDQQVRFLEFKNTYQSSL